MRRFLFGCLAIVGLIFVLGMAGVAGLGYWALREGRQAAVPKLGERLILRARIEGGVPERASTDPIEAALSDNPMGLRDMVEAIDRAAGDDRVKGLFLDLSGSRVSLASAQELRASIERFRRGGKVAFAYATTFSGGGDLQNLYLATGCDQIWMQPSGEIGATGVALEIPFAADGLAMLGVKPRFDQRWEFKGGVDSFLAKGMSQPLRDQLQSVVDDLLRQVVDGVAMGRGLTPETVRAAIDQAPLFADQALARKFVTGTGYLDDAETQAQRASGGVEFTDLRRYLEGSAAADPAGARVAVITGVGTVVEGRGEDGIGEDLSLRSGRIAAALRSAAHDTRVKAIILRIDSPGGSYVASDTVWHAVHAARAAGKPVVASMGARAASGGYFIAMAADKVVADPASLTGSIGVYSGKFVLTGLWDKLGVAWDRVAAGAHAGGDSMNRDFTPDEYKSFEAGLDRVYADFTSKAAADRGLSNEKIDQVARGRVWTGAQAQKVGLVDRLGDFQTAVDEARSLAGIAANAPVELAPYPAPENAIDRLFNAAKRLQGVTKAMAPLAGILERLGPLVDAATPEALKAPLTAP